MWIPKKPCVFSATVLLCLGMLVVIGFYHTSTSQVPTFEQHTRIRHTHVVELKDGNRWSTLEQYFDLERLEKKFSNEACPNRDVAMMKSSFDKNTGLLSFPASGNTWTRHMIEQLSGIQTCSFRSRSNTKANIRSGTRNVCIVYKSHRQINQFDGAVIIIRNPLYALKSYFHYLHGEVEGKSVSSRNRIERHKSYANKSLFLSPAIISDDEVTTTSSDIATCKELHDYYDNYKSNFKILKEEKWNITIKKFNIKFDEWTSHVEKKLPLWKNSYIYWMKHYTTNSMILVYENLKKNVASELLRIIRFLQIETSPKDFWCTLVNKEGDAHRTPLNTETSVFNLFNEEQKKAVIEAVCDVARFAKKLDYDLDLSQYLVNLTVSPNTACD